MFIKLPVNEKTAFVATVASSNTGVFFSNFILFCIKNLFLLPISYYIMIFRFIKKMCGFHKLLLADCGNIAVIFMSDAIGPKQKHTLLDAISVIVFRFSFISKYFFFTKSGVFLIKKFKI